MIIMSQDGKNEKDKDTYKELGKFYFLNGKYDEALQEFQKAMDIDDQDSELYYNIGLIYESRNKRDEAQDSYEQALEISPKHALARKHLNHLIGIDKDISPKKK